MNKIFSVFFACLFILAASAGMANELSENKVIGTWTFTHLIMDGGKEMKVNEKVVFGADGSYTQYHALSGEPRGTATWAISGNTIKYADDNGEQDWKLVSVDDEQLRVDHRGAEMVFERQ